MKFFALHAQTYPPPVEPYDDDGLRARIFKTTDIAHDRPTPDAASTIEDVCAIVKNWLEEFTGADAI